MQTTWKLSCSTSCTRIALLLALALNVDCVSCARAARLGTLPLTFRLPLQSALRYTRRRALVQCVFNLPQSLSRFRRFWVSERVLEWDYVAALEPRAQEEAEEAWARALSPCLRGHETRNGGEICKKGNICSGSDFLPQTGGDTETTDHSVLQCSVLLFFTVHVCYT